MPHPYHALFLLSIEESNEFEPLSWRKIQSFSDPWVAAIVLPRQCIQPLFSNCNFKMQRCFFTNLGQAAKVVQNTLIMLDPTVEP